MKGFFADRASLLAADLGIDEKDKPVIEKHIKFLAEKERTVVIISDALRYEVGRELLRKMQDDPKCTATLFC